MQKIFEIRCGLCAGGFDKHVLFRCVSPHFSVRAKRRAEQHLIGAIPRRRSKAWLHRL